MARKHLVRLAHGMTIGYCSECGGFHIQFSDSKGTVFAQFIADEGQILQITGDLMIVCDELTADEDEIGETVGTA